MADELTESTLPLPLPLQHLQLRFRALNRDILAAIQARRQATMRQAMAIDPREGEESEPQAEASILMQLLQAMNPQNRVFISDQQVDYVISELEALCQDEYTALSEQELRADAKKQGLVLPLDRLEFEIPLSPTQMDAVILCAAPEFDSAYEILFAFILNDIGADFRALSCSAHCPAHSATVSTAVSSWAGSAGSGCWALSFRRARRRASYVRSSGSRRTLRFPARRPWRSHGPLSRH